MHIFFLHTDHSPGTQEDEDDPEFRLFKKQAYHAQLVKIYEPLRAAMTKPEVAMCPDGHYRKVIYSLGPFMADYPEQVYLACIVQGWCPKCVRSWSISSALLIRVQM